ncbi:MAG: dihydrofolate reductase [Pseudomonadota bacterium]|nr:dihydrofolate reductase [Pseudomonadota bacterium]
MNQSDVVLVAALDRNGAIGRGNALPWHLPDDLKRFKEQTFGKPVLMGRRTAEAIGRALPGRRNIVLTRSGTAPFTSMDAVDSVAAALRMAADDGAEQLAVIGGGEVYALTLPMATRLYLTHVDTEVADADAFFPRFDEARWHAVSREPHARDERHAFGFEFVEYVPVGVR